MSGLLSVCSQRVVCVAVGQGLDGIREGYRLKATKKPEAQNVTQGVVQYERDYNMFLVLGLLDL